MRSFKRGTLKRRGINQPENAFGIHEHAVPHLDENVDEFSPQFQEVREILFGYIGVLSAQAILR
jgi:hypothetical protein